MRQTRLIKSASGKLYAVSISPVPTTPNGKWDWRIILSRLDRVAVYDSPRELFVSGSRQLADDVAMSSME